MKIVVKDEWSKVEKYSAALFFATVLKTREP